MDQATFTAAASSRYDEVTDVVLTEDAAARLSHDVEMLPNFASRRVQFKVVSDGSTGQPRQRPDVRRVSDSSGSTPVDSDPRPEDGSDVEPLRISPSTGCADVDARLLLWRVRNVDAAIKLTRIAVSAEIADRFVVLRNHPCDTSSGEEPLKFESIRWFLDYYLRRRKEDRPLIGMTPDGIVEANWLASKGRHLTIRFFADGRVWVAVRGIGNSGSCEMLARDLLSDRSLIRIPDWA